MSWDPYESNSYYSNNSWADELYGRDAMDSWRESNSYDDSDFSSYFSSSSDNGDWLSDLNLSNDDLELPHIKLSSNYKHKPLTPEETYWFYISQYNDKWLAEYMAKNYGSVNFENMTDHMKACNFHVNALNYVRDIQLGIENPIIGYFTEKYYIDTKIMSKSSFLGYVNYIREFVNPEEFLQMYVNRPHDNYSLSWCCHKNSCVMFYPNGDNYTMYYYIEKDNDGDSVLGIIQNISRDEFVDIESNKKYLHRDYYEYDEDKLNKLFNDDRNIVIANKPEYIVKMMLDDYHFRGVVGTWYLFNNRHNDSPMSKYYQRAIERGTKKTRLFERDLTKEVHNICEHDTGFRYDYILQKLKEFKVIDKNCKIV